MKITEVSLRNPVFITMCVLAIVVLGVIGYTRLPVEFFPDISLPIVAVTIPYPGASPEDVENQITKPVEEALSVLRGVRHIRSTSTQGVSVVILEFEMEESAKEMALEVREKVANIRGTLPREILEPQYEKFDPSDSPIITYAVTATDSSITPSDLRYLITKKLEPFLEQIEGLASISLLGGEEREIEVAVSRDRLAAAGLQIDDVVRAIRNANVEMPGGRIQNNTQEFLLKTNASLKDPKEIAQIVVKNASGFPIRIGDVADIRDTTKEARQLSRANGIPSVTMDIRKQSGANTVEVAARIREKMDNITAEFPTMRASLAYDDSKFIRDSRDDVVSALLEGIVLASLVVLLFFRDLRSTIITVAGLPVCIIGTFFVIYLLGYTINIITLMALSLSIGLLIDDAIVVRENIFRWMEKGKSPWQAARDATSEVALAVLATSLTVVSVFLPIAFATGIAGKFFRQFGITISVAVLISLIEAFTVAPMLSAYFFRKLDKDKRSHNKVGLWFSSWFDGLDVQYHRILTWALSHRMIVVGIATVIFIASIGIVSIVGVSGDKHGDRGQYSIVIEASQDISLQEMNRRVEMAETITRNHPETLTYFTTVGSEDGSPNQASILVNTKQLGKSMQIREQIRPLLQKILGLSISLEEVGGIRNKAATIQQRPIQLNIQGSDMTMLKRISTEIEKRIRPVSGIVDLDNSLRSGKPEYQYKMKRDNLARYGLSASDVGSLIGTVVGGTTASTYRDGDDDVEINVRFDRTDRSDPVQLLSYGYPLKDGRVIPLSELVELVQVIGPAQINRQDRSRQVIINANITDRALSEILSDIKKQLSTYKFPTGYTIKYEGQASQNAEMFGSLYLALALAIVFVYMVLASEFNSFMHPFTIMLSLPLAVIGGFFGLMFAHKSFDMLAFIGLIMLMGLVTKNSILLIDFTNRLRREGKSIREALLLAGPIRLRPILMTTFSMIFGMLPTALGMGPSGDFRVALGVIVIGGLISSTALTLIVVPVAYDMMETVKRKLGFKESFIGTVEATQEALLAEKRTSELQAS